MKCGGEGIEHCEVDVVDDAGEAGQWGGVRGEGIWQGEVVEGIVAELRTMSAMAERGTGQGVKGNDCCDGRE